MEQLRVTISRDSYTKRVNIYVSRTKSKYSVYTGNGVIYSVQNVG